MDVDRYRGLIGAALHIVPHVYDLHRRLDNPAGVGPIRVGCAPSDFLRPKRWPRGLCLWCGQPSLGVRGGKLRWHLECQRWYYAARGQAGPWVSIHNGGKFHPSIPPGPCVQCGVDFRNGRGPSGTNELDHCLAVGVAARQGPRAHVRALTLPNMVWLCHTCHKDKTAEDRRIMTALDRARADYAAGHRQLLPISPNFPNSPEKPLT